MVFVTVVQFGSNPWQAKRIYNAVLKDNRIIGNCSFEMILIFLIISIDMIMFGFMFKDFRLLLIASKHLEAGGSFYYLIYVIYHINI